MFSIECAFDRAPDGTLVFKLLEEVPDSHEDWCELEAIFVPMTFYLPEPDVGAGLTWDGDIDEIRIHIWGRPRALDGESLENARAFLLKHYGYELYQSGDDDAELMFYEAA